MVKMVTCVDGIIVVMVTITCVDGIIVVDDGSSRCQNSTSYEDVEQRLCIPSQIKLTASFYQKL